MSTYSVIELIGIEFDKFYDNIKFYGIDLETSGQLGDLLTNLEHNVILHAQSKYTTEVEEIEEEAYDRGYEAGREVAYDEGYQDGYEQAMGQIE